MATDLEATRRLIIKKRADVHFGQIIKSKHKSLVSGRKQVRISNLVASFSQYLASRNVISWPDSVGDLSSPQGGRYERIVSGTKTTPSKPTRSLKLLKEPRSNFEEIYATPNVSATQRPMKWNSKAYDESASSSSTATCCCCWPSRWTLNTCRCHSCAYRCSKSAKPRKLTRQLLGALWSGSSEASRVHLLIRLLRAPIVLAALFSLALVASILVLYTLSFQDHHFRLVSFASGGSNTTTTTTTTGNIQDLLGLVVGHDRLATRAHHINSRHLLQAEADEFPTARTECATYLGVAEGPAFVFKGIAYALPPVGGRRWARPRPVWLHDETCRPDERRKAQDFRSHCLQVSPFSRQVSGQEDCLYLDIFVPKNSSSTSKALPVMVYIHGGFLAYGSSGQEGQQQQQVNWMRSRPSGQLASELNVVLVALNYRLQALGFMALAQLAEGNGGQRGGAANDTPTTNGAQPEDTKSEGNYGLWDQLVALNWIKRNIESFGGAPDNIVVFGPDSASSLPLALLGPAPANKPPPVPLNESPGQFGGSPEEAHSTASRSATTSDGHPAADQLMDRNLFRAAWLTNPAVYYGLAPELANKHYERLIESQSICSSAAKPTTTGGGGSGPSRTLLDCLVGLHGQQVVREYLGRDDPAFRLDDQSSLPIKNIFPDQFVTVDGLLVRNSFPFTRRQVAAASAQDTSHSNESNVATKSTTKEANDSQRKRMLIGSSAQAVEYWPCPRDLYHWNWEDFRRYVGTSLNSFTQETYRQASQMYRVPLEGASGGGGGGGNSTDPVETYLSMVSDIKQICPINELVEAIRSPDNQISRYIVEWRPSDQFSASLKQPGNNCGAEQAQEQNMSPSKQQQQPQQHKPRFAFHYWDLMAFFGFQFEPDLRPNEMDLRFQQEIRKMVKEFVWNDYDDELEQPNGPQQQQQQPQNDPNGQDQHRHQDSHSNGFHDNQNMRRELHRKQNGAQGGHDEDVNDDHDGFMLFALDGFRKKVKEFRQNECKMWARFLKQSYAWIS